MTAAELRPPSIRPAHTAWRHPPYSASTLPTEPGQSIRARRKLSGRPRLLHGRGRLASTQRSRLSRDTPHEPIRPYAYPQRRGGGWLPTRWAVLERTAKLLEECPPVRGVPRVPNATSSGLPGRQRVDRPARSLGRWAPSARLRKGSLRRHTGEPPRTQEQKRPKGSPDSLKGSHQR